MRCVGSVDLGRTVARIPPPASRSARGVRRWHEAIELVRAEALVADAAYSYRIVPLDAVEIDALRCDGEALRASGLVPASGVLTALACVVCTLGVALEQRVSALFAERRASVAVALDALGNELLYALSRQVQDRILGATGRQQLTMSGELHPGDPGLDLDAQPALLRLAGADAIGVTLTEGSLLRPHKSLSMLLGVGIGLPATTWSRCERCPSVTRCARRASAAVPIQARA